MGSAGVDLSLDGDHPQNKIQFVTWGVTNSPGSIVFQYMSPTDQFPRPLDQVAELFEMLAGAAVEQARELHEQRTRSQHKRQSVSRRPGPDTPLWNALIAAVRPHLVKRGSKSNLARILGVPRQRIYDTITRPTVMPDAETALHLLLWLANQNNLSSKGRHAHPLA